LPDIVLPDCYIPVLNGLDISKIIKARYPSFKIQLQGRTAQICNEKRAGRAVNGLFPVN